VFHVAEYDCVFVGTVRWRSGAKCHKTQCQC